MIKSMLLTRGFLRPEKVEYVEWSHAGGFRHTTIVGTF